MSMWKDIMNILQCGKELWRCEQLQKNFYRLELLFYIQMFERRQNQHRRTSMANKYSKDFNYKFSVLSLVNSNEDLTLVLNVNTNSVASMTRWFTRASVLSVRSPPCFKMYS